MASSRPTHIRYKGLVWVRCTKEDWEFEGGETNPDLLRLQDRKSERKCFNYFRLRGLN